MSNYEALEQHFSDINDLDHVAAIVGWDEAAMMPSGGGDARANAMSTLSVLIHNKTIDPRIAEWVDGCSNEELSDWQQANLHQISRAYAQATCMPEALVKANSQARSRCEQTWRTCRADNDWQTMLPLLRDVIDLTIEEAEIRSEHQNLDPYDALLDLYEPNTRSSQIETLFAPLRAQLPQMIPQILERQAASGGPVVEGPFTIDAQRDLGLKLMRALGFDFDHGRLDISHHPFCGGVPDDVRITTRYDDADFSQALMGVLHESGHALYEQGLPSSWRTQPVGRALSMATHESQSLFVEMQLCRSREFFEFMAPLAQQAFAGSGPAWQAENMHSDFTKVQPGYIRVDADEVTYPLHVILRFDIERALISKDLEVADLPDAWNEKMQHYLGLNTKGNYHDGCLQDVHWPAGLIGYFPTYTLGAMTAAQLFQALSQTGMDTKGLLCKGDFAPIVQWLRDNIHSHGCSLTQDALLTKATGGPLNADAFLNHLQQRYLP